MPLPNEVFFLHPIRLISTFHAFVAVFDIPYCKTINAYCKKHYFWIFTVKQIYIRLDSRLEILQVSINPAIE